MDEPEPLANEPDYGLDAPGVVRNLVLVGIAGMAVWAARRLGYWNDRMVAALFFHPIMVMGAVCFLMAGWMWWESRVGKLRRRERVLDALSLRGDERVLDVGCGRGLYLIGAAERLTTGKAIGVDIWNAADLSGNSDAATRQNIKFAEVEDRVELKTADARELPFEDGSFDLILSSNAIHNIPGAAGRAKAIGEMARVLRAGGRVEVIDIAHLDDYARVLKENGVEATVRRAWYWPIQAAMSMGVIRSGRVSGKKG